MQRYLFNREHERASCGVGFITHKQSQQTHDLLQHAHQALCMIPHRGGMNAQGIGDGAGVNIDLSLNFFRHITGTPRLKKGEFAVANLFYPKDPTQHSRAEALVYQLFQKFDYQILTRRSVAVNPEVLNKASQATQLDIKQIIFARPDRLSDDSAFEKDIYDAMQELEAIAYTDASLYGLYPLSMSCRTQVLKGRLNSWEVIPYFADLMDPEHCIHTLFFHTRFSTNTAPNPMFAQPFNHMAHNGELNTDRKNRISESAIARSQNRQLVFPRGQSDSARFDQTLTRRVREEQAAIDFSVLSMMPPAWENDGDLEPEIRNMLAFLSLYEEKNDGPAAVIFSDGIKVGARLDRLGLRPLRTVETSDYLAVMSEAGQIAFAPETIISQGKIEAGGMIVFNHQDGSIKYSNQIMSDYAKTASFCDKLKDTATPVTSLPTVAWDSLSYPMQLTPAARYVGYGLNQESLKFMLDPMLQSGSEKITAMGYGIAPNPMVAEEGGISRFFSQRFAQVTNPPLDSIREADGMTLRVALGPKPVSWLEDSSSRHQLVVDSPILQPLTLVKIEQQSKVKVATVDTTYSINLLDKDNHQSRVENSLAQVVDQIERVAVEGAGIVLLTDIALSHEKAALPAMLVIAAANQRLIKQGLRFDCSLIYQTGQAASTHDIACLLGFGASAVCPTSVFFRARELYITEEAISSALNRYQKAVDKALMKTMGKFGLCTAESYIGGEFFEANFIDTLDPLLQAIFPNIHSPVGGVGFADIVNNSVFWHAKMTDTQSEKCIPVLGLFKERSNGAGHSFGNTAVREYVQMADETIAYTDHDQNDESLLDVADNHARLPDDPGYKDLGYQARSPEQIDQFNITSGYRNFVSQLEQERDERPATLRDLLSLPLDLLSCTDSSEMAQKIAEIHIAGSAKIALVGVEVNNSEDGRYHLCSLQPSREEFYPHLITALTEHFADQVTCLEQSPTGLYLQVTGIAAEFLSRLCTAPQAIALDDIQPAHQITAQFASGAMSHGALVAKAHEAVAQGTNIAGAMSNSGEGGERSGRYNSVKASKIKQFASGRFGVWTGYLADPSLQEIEIKIAQGAKPGEGGQLPAAKVNVEIAAARGGTPGVELVSPPPHHDTYSIEDLGQLIHDAKAARVRVIVKLVSSEGIGTIAVGVAKAGADVINVAGGTGGTGAAQVTSLKHTGRIAELGIAEVHQALSENGLRDKITLRCSNAHQTGVDVIKSAIMGGDSFEFGTTALMMLKCVMAKNCNIKCPAGLTTNPELYEGDPRALAQYFLNIAHEVRELLAKLGFDSLRAIRGRTELLHLIQHRAVVGRLDMSALLRRANYVSYENPVYLEANFSVDDQWWLQVEQYLSDTNNTDLSLPSIQLNNCNKTTGGQLSVDIERLLNYKLSDQTVDQHPALYRLAGGRVVMAESSVSLTTDNSAGQSYGAFNTSGVNLHHYGTCNDGVGKSASGGKIVVTNPPTISALADNVLVGNFALFGATGGELFVSGKAGDRFGVRNSGAVAVIEGVGDFGCEYMTNGCVVNLGGYGKGFGNGMSGGIAFQYDPSGNILQRCSQDSVVAITLSQVDELNEAMTDALYYHLSRHVEHTQSVLATKMISQWPQVKSDFYVLIPRSLFNSQCAENIASNSDTKAQVEELTQYYVSQQIKQIKAAYQAGGNGLFDGQVPAFSEGDSALVYQYVNATAAISRAFELASKSDLVVSEKESIDDVTRYLFDSEDKKLTDALIKDYRAVFSQLDEKQLVHLLADKRLTDYKQSLILREVSDSRALATSAWIMHRHQQNHQALTEYSCWTEILAQNNAQLLAETSVKYHTDGRV